MFELTPFGGIFTAYPFFKESEHSEKRGQAPAFKTDIRETEAAYLGIALQMRTSAGNEFKRLSVTFDIQIHATQVNYEEDSVGDDYDAGLTPGV